MQRIRMVYLNYTTVTSKRVKGMDMDSLSVQTNYSNMMVNGFKIKDKAGEL